MLTDLVTEIHLESHGTYGILRVHAELTMGRGVEVGHNQVELLMRRAGLSFWSRMPVELLDRKKWNTRLELVNAMFHYLEIWHNRQRRHSQLGWLTPVEFERNRVNTVA
jgi:hypothetical protein